MKQILIHIEKKEEMKLNMLNTKQKALFELDQAIIIENIIKSMD